MNKQTSRNSDIPAAYGARYILTLLAIYTVAAIVLIALFKIGGTV
jgi:hypothetical protein